MYTKRALSFQFGCYAIGGHIYTPDDEAAKARTPLIVTHGGPGGSCYTLEASLHALAQHRPVVFYDQAGSHLSPAELSDALIQPERFGQEAAAVADYMQYPQCYFLGHSWGGVVALEFAQAHAQRVAGLILSSPLISTPIWIRDANALLAALPQDIQNTIHTHMAAGTTDHPDFRAANDVFMAQHYCRLAKPWPTIMDVGHKHFKPAIYNTMWGPTEFACTGTLKDYDASPYLAHITCPVLLTCGQYDEARPDTMQDFARAMHHTNAKVHVFKNSAHTPYIEEAQAYIACINNFLMP